jgi:hypothetical protein
VDRNTSPRIIKYVATFALTHFSLSLGIGYALQTLLGRRPAGIGLVVIIAACLIVAQFFGSKNGRVFTSRESSLLVAGGFAYLLCLEFATLILASGANSSLSGQMWAVVALVTVSLDFLVTLYGFKVLAPRGIEAYLRKRRASLPNQSLERGRER